MGRRRYGVRRIPEMCFMLIDTDLCFQSKQSKIRLKTSLNMTTGLPYDGRRRDVFWWVRRLPWRLRRRLWLRGRLQRGSFSCSLVTLAYKLTFRSGLHDGKSTSGRLRRIRRWWLLHRLMMFSTCNNLTSRPDEPHIVSHDGPPRPSSQ